MTNKRLAILSILILISGMTQITYADNNESHMESMTHHNMMPSMDDERISLGLPPQMKQHQLSNMRSHLEAVEEIIGFIVEGQYDNASATAHSKLGLTDEMKKMCDMFKNDDFRELGITFHKSGDALGDALLTKDVNKSLRALQNTMGYCVQCHATFRQ